jgi:ribosomal protein L19
LEFKACKICKVEKELSSQFFYKKPDNKTGFEYNCKLCASLIKKIYREQNVEKGILQSKNYYQQNREKVLARTSKNNKINSLKVNKRKRDRLKRDNIYYLRDLVSRTIGNALRKTNNRKDGSIRKYLPYTMQELKEHLEKQFEPWMTWQNRGRYDANTWDDADITTWTWNIDHIVPQSKLPYSSMADENFQKCWALENLRPLSAKQNIIDGNRRKL